MDEAPSFRSGFAAVIGRPNVGKSTLLNTLLRRKVAIVTPHPQTTRARLLGVLSVAGSERHAAGQIVFLDTPGIHRARTPLNRRLLRQTRTALEDSDLALFVVDATRRWGAEDEFALRMLADSAARRGGEPRDESGGESAAEPAADPPPAILVVNKIDRLADKRALLPLLGELSARHPFAATIPVSAKTGDQTEALVKEILARLPHGPEYFPAGMQTDQPEMFRAAEIIREKAMLATRAELPHALAVGIEAMDLGARPRISAVIYCEREGQKAILIGRGGEMIKRIGVEARAEIEAGLERGEGGAGEAAARGRRPLYLELRVETRPNWRRDERFLRHLDYRTTDLPPESAPR